MRKTPYALPDRQGLNGAAEMTDDDWRSYKSKVALCQRLSTALHGAPIRNRSLPKAVKLLERIVAIHPDVENDGSPFGCCCCWQISRNFAKGIIPQELPGRTVRRPPIAYDESFLNFYDLSSIMKRGSRRQA